MPMFISDAFLAFRETVSPHPVFALGVLLAGGWLLGTLAEKAGVPSITGFILAGMLLGPKMAGMVHYDLNDKLQTVTGIAIAVVAVLIGTQLNIPRLRRIGKAMVTITVFQLFGTFLLVFAALAAVGILPLQASMVLAAIATATSPTATVAIVRNLRARGDFIDHLYGAIPLDDAGCIFLFAAVAAYFSGFVSTGAGSVPESVVHFSTEIAGSAVLGIAAGLLVRRAASRRESSNSVYIVSLGVVCMMTALAGAFHLSPLLAGMTAGAVVATSRTLGRNVIEGLERLSPPLYAVFFAVAGTELDPGVFGHMPVVALGAIYIVARAAGKYSGVWLGAKVAGSEVGIRRYLGLAMMPHSGISVGLLLYVQSSPAFRAMGHGVTSMVVSVVLMSVFVNELVGPVLSKLAVSRGSSTERNR